MKKIIIHKSLFLILTILLIGATPAASPTNSSTSAEIDSDTIKENVKKRIESVVRGDNDAPPTIYSLMGSIISRANLAFSINTKNGTKQVSATTDTTFIRLPDKKTIKLDDISLDDYLTAIGTFNENQEVLTATRLIVQSLPPKPPENQVFYGIIASLDLKKRLITIDNTAAKESKTFLISRNVDIQQTNSLGESSVLKLDDLEDSKNILVVYTPAASSEDDNVIYTIQTSPSEIVDVAEDSTPSAKKATPKPPELNP